MSEQAVRAIWHWCRGCVISGIFLFVCCLHMSLSMTPGTSWEHHPFSGPLIVLHTAIYPVDYCIGGLMWVGLGAGLCLPAFRVNVLTVIVSIAAGCVWVIISISAAASAAC